MTLAAGSRLGPYEILAPIGAGGMGEVYRAKDPRLGREVAVKVLPASFSNDADRLRRFEQEARAAGILNHPNITAVYDIGTVEDAPYVVTELLEGETLRSRLSGGALAPRRAIDYAVQIAHGLAAAHEKGIVHRDLKPENLFVTKDGRIKILDFGLAKLTQPEESGLQTNLPTATAGTEPGVVLGTLGYMSPEQVRGRPADARSDIFSFGAILYEMLSGKRAFHGDSAADTMSAILREDPPDLSATNKNINPGLDRVVRHCLEKSPEERFHSAHDLAFDLEALSGLSGATAVTPIHAARARRFPLFLSAILATAVLTAIVTLAVSRPKATEPPRTNSLTFSGSDTAPSASPDGRLIAFVSDRDGRSRIWMKQLPNGDEVALTSGEDGSPRFSPDGSSLLFVRAEEGGTSLYRISVVGGAPQKMIENAQAGDWSPDGSRVVFLRSRGQVGRAMGSIVAVAAIDGSGERRIAEETELPLSSPRWSPDGKTIGAVRAGGTVSKPDEITLFDAETGKRSSLPPSSGGGTISSFAWIGEDRRILYAESVEPTGLVNLSRVVALDVRSADVRTLLWVPNIVSCVDVLRSGAVVFDALLLPQNLREIPIPRTEKGGEQWVTRGNSADRQPIYSPDGEWIAYSSSRSGNTDIWRIARDGTVRRLTEDPADEWDPGFTRDGKTLLFSSNRSGHFEVWAAEADGRRARQVTHDGYDAENPVATPDGRWIVYSSGNPQKRGLWKVRPDGSGAVYLVADGVLHPEVSPDGRYVLYHTPPDPGWTELRAVNTEDGKPVDFRIRLAYSGTQAPLSLQRSLGSLGRARWMPDGRAIAFVAVDEKGQTGVMVQDFAPGRDTTASRRSLAGFDGELNAESLGISPDGSRLVVSAVTTSSSLMLTEGFEGISPKRRSSK